MPSSRGRNQSPLSNILSILSSDLGIITITVLTIIGIWLVDTITPLGEPVWLLYFIPLILSYWSSRYYAIPVICTGIMLFLIAGFFLSPQGIAISYAMVFRFTFYLIFISVALILWSIRRQQILEERL